MCVLLAASRTLYVGGHVSYDCSRSYSHKHLKQCDLVMTRCSSFKFCTTVAMITKRAIATGWPRVDLVAVTVLEHWRQSEVRRSGRCR